VTDTWTWATVTQASPLRIKVDGDTTALDATTDDLVGSLAVDDRVRVHLHSDGIIVTGVQGGGNRSNPNLLINSNFMVNQRGAVSGAGVAFDAYFLDRWKGVAGDPRPVSWSDSGGVRTLVISDGNSNQAIRQVVEKANVPAGEITLSWDRDCYGTVYQAGSTPAVLLDTSPVTITVDGTTDVVVDVVGAGSRRNLTHVKLERGPIATPYQHPTYADNLRTCMRYYQRFGGINLYEPIGQGAAQSTTVAVIQVPLVVPMRAGPTVTSSTLALYDQTTSRATTVGAYVSWASP